MCEFMFGYSCMLWSSDVQSWKYKPTLNNIDRIYDISETFTHFPSLRVSDHGMKKNLLKRQLAGELKAEHYHSSHPKEENIIACFQEIAWEILLELIAGLVRPPKR